MSDEELDEKSDEKSDEQAAHDDRVQQVCAACKKSFEPEDDGQTVCVECQEWRRALVIVGLFLLFFSFVVLPLLIQVLNTPKP